MYYRIKQFVWAITARLSKEEKIMLRHYLDQWEYEKFSTLKVYEQKHSLQLASKITQKDKNNHTKEMIRLALLHDLGKIKYPIGPVRKSIMVLLDTFTKGKIQKYTQFKMIKCYYNHPQIGYEILKARGGYDNVFLEAIKKHHQKPHKSDSYQLKQLRRWDNEC